MRSCCLLLLSLALVSSALASNPKSQKAFREGLRHEGAGQWKDAEKAYSQAIQNDPSDVSFYRHRGKIRSLLGDPQHALEDWNEVIRLLPGDAAAYQLR